MMLTSSTLEVRAVVTINHQSTALARLTLLRSVTVHYVELLSVIIFTATLHLWSHMVLKFTS